MFKRNMGKYSTGMFLSRMSVSVRGFRNHLKEGTVEKIRAWWLKRRQDAKI